MKLKNIRQVTYHQWKLPLLIGGTLLSLTIFFLLELSGNKLSIPFSQTLETFSFGQLKIARTLPNQPSSYLKQNENQLPVQPEKQFTTPAPISTEQKEELKSVLTNDILNQLPEILQIEILELLQ